MNEGCSPTKTIVASARIAHLARRAADYGVQLPGAPATVGVDLRRVRERKQNIVDSFRGGSEKALATSGAELVRGHARFVAPRTVEVGATAPSASDAPKAGGRRLTADTVVINTGLRPAIPPLRGLDDLPYLTSTSVMEVPDHLIVLGGGYVGVEFAQAYRRFGSRVTIVQRGAQLLGREDPDVADAVAELLREDGIEVLRSADAARVERRGSDVRLLWRPTQGQGDAPRAADDAGGELAARFDGAGRRLRHGRESARHSPRMASARHRRRHRQVASAPD